MERQIADTPTAGIGLKPEYYPDALQGRAEPGFFEVHAENYLLPGGPRLRTLERIRCDYPISIHGVAASLGSVMAVDEGHLRALAELVRRIDPFIVSEHAAWSREGGRYHADLLPLPYTSEALGCLARNVERMQAVLGRQILIENPSTYLEFRASDMGEAEFLATLVNRTGCGLLLDVNNLFVSSRNHGFDAHAYLEQLPGAAIGQYHLAGHTLERHGRVEIRIDTHDAPVIEAVWQLFQDTVRRFGPHPVLIERDDHLPSFDVLLDEALRAQSLMRAATPPDRARIDAA